MAVYAVAERQLKPGGWPLYHEAMQAIDACLGRDPNRGPYSLYLAEGRDDQVLGIGLWRQRDDLAAASQMLPAPLIARLEAAVADGEGDWQWYRSVRQRRAFTGAPRLVGAARLRIAEEDHAPFHAWAIAIQDRAIQLPGVLTQHLLQCEDDPESFIHLAEYADAAARAAALADLAAHPSPVELVGFRRFVGKLEHYWARDEALGRGQLS